MMTWFNRRLALPVAVLIAAAGVSIRITAQDNRVSPDLYSGLRWRNIGPFHGGRIGGRGGRGGGAAAPADVRPFNTINGTFNTVVALTQNGIDMAPTPAMVHTYEAGCTEFTATLAAWKTLLTKDLVALNARLSDAGKPPIKIPPTRLVAPASCTFAPVAAAPVKK